MNFVTGVNGSGKSSIMLGLVLGLFAESKQTKRFSRIQDFVQKGSRQAVIQITLRNEGDDAYKPEVYGKAITFKRTITDRGASAVSLLGENSHTKKKQRQAREEGKRILRGFNISVDNPIVILQQDQAKELLQMESPEKLYHFFVVNIVSFSNFCLHLGTITSETTCAHAMFSKFFPRPRFLQLVDPTVAHFLFTWDVYPPPVCRKSRCFFKFLLLEGDIVAPVHGAIHRGRDQPESNTVRIFFLKS